MRSMGPTTIHNLLTTPAAANMVTSTAKGLLAIIQGTDAYISPSWYESKAEHGRVVPTWNCSTAHVYGRPVIHDDLAWLENHLRALNNLNEAGTECPWTVDDAAERYISGQLKAIVSIYGVVPGLHERGDAQMAHDVEQANPRLHRLATASGPGGHMTRPHVRVPKGHARQSVNSCHPGSAARGIPAPA